jgi:hypothetical protein
VKKNLIISTAFILLSASWANNAQAIARASNPKDLDDKMVDLIFWSSQLDAKNKSEAQLKMVIEQVKKNCAVKSLENNKYSVNNATKHCTDPLSAVYDKVAGIMLEHNVIKSPQTFGSVSAAASALSSNSLNSKMVELIFWESQLNVRNKSEAQLKIVVEQVKKNCGVKNLGNNKYTVNITTKDCTDPFSAIYDKVAGIMFEDKVITAPKTFNGSVETRPKAGAGRGGPLRAPPQAGPSRASRR